MKNKTISFFIISSLILIFVIFFKGLNKSSLYEPTSKIENIPNFSTITFFQKEEVNSTDVFNKKKFYLLNIWASWCLPCREEHSLLVYLSKNDKLEIIGLNYKDNFSNAEKFLYELGNPYEKILIDRDGTKSIELGAFGVPETFVVFQNKIIKKFIGPLNSKSVAEIKEIIQ
tara:strand:- start:557 stop:1072 length:516 start_codon:yes stop_codon:yes gene_type:complete